MELRQLKYFVNVARTLSFSEAAKNLFITQGTLSQQIKQLEDELGAELFTRTSRNVMLTEAGTELLPLAQQAIQDSESCKLAIANLRKGLSGAINIGLTSSFRDLLTDSVKRFIRNNPQIQFNIYYKTATELFKMLRAREVDFILAFKPIEKMEDIVSENLFNSELCAVMYKEHPLAGRKSLSFDELMRQKIVLPGSGLQARRAFDRFTNLNTSSLNVAIELNEPHILMQMLHNTNLIAIVSSLATHYDPDLVAIPIEEMRRTMEGCVHWLKGAYKKKAAEVFIETLRDSNSIMQI